MTPHFEAHGITLFVGDACELVSRIDVVPLAGADLLIMDPPYGVEARARSNRTRPLALERIAGDESRDAGEAIVRAAWPRLRYHRHCYCFGDFRIDSLEDSSGHCELIWDKVIASMGDLDSPWGAQHEKIQFAQRSLSKAQAAVEGKKLARIRRGSVLRYARPCGLGAKHHIAEKSVPMLRARGSQARCRRHRARPGRRRWAGHGRLEVRSGDLRSRRSRRARANRAARP